MNEDNDKALIAVQLHVKHAMAPLCIVISCLLFARVFQIHSAKESLIVAQMNEN